MAKFQDMYQNLTRGFFQESRGEVERDAELRQKPHEIDQLYAKLAAESKLSEAELSRKLQEAFSFANRTPTSEEVCTRSCRMDFAIGNGIAQFHHRLAETITWCIFQDWFRLIMQTPFPNRKNNHSTQNKGSSLLSRVKSHGKRKTCILHTEPRWAMEKTAWEVVGGERT